MPLDRTLIFSSDSEVANITTQMMLAENAMTAHVLSSWSAEKTQSPVALFPHIQAEASRLVFSRSPSNAAQEGTSPQVHYHALSQNMMILAKHVNAHKKHPEHSLSDAERDAMKYGLAVALLATSQAYTAKAATDLAIKLLAKEDAAQNITALFAL